MATVGSLAVNVVANTGPFAAGMRTARKEASLLSSSFDKLKGAAIGFGATIAAGFAISSLRSTAEELDKIAKDSIRLGIATDKLQGLERVADLAGASAEDVVKGIGKMEVAISKGGKGFEKLKLSATQLKALKPEEAFERIADAIKAIPNVDDRMASVKAIFGKGGAALMPTLMQGGAAIAAGIDEHGKLTADQAVQIQKANDAMKELGMAFTDLKTLLIVELAPAITDAIKTITNIVGGKANANGVVAGGLVATPGVTRGAESNMYDQILGKMTDAEFRKFQHDFKQKDRDLSKGIGGPTQDAQGNWVGGQTLSELVQSKAGIDTSKFDYTTFVTAMDQRTDKIVKPITDRVIADEQKRQDSLPSALAGLGDMFGTQLKDAWGGAKTVGAGLAQIPGIAAEQVRRQEEEQARRAKEASGIAASVQSPAEQAKQELDKALSLFKTGDLGGDTVDRLIKQWDGQLAGQKRHLGIVERGSREAFDFARGRDSSKDPQTQIAKTAKEQLDVLKAIRDKNPPAPLVMDIGIS